jgi:hypothetical protein
MADRPSDFSFREYFGIQEIFIPQYNIALGMTWQDSKHPKVELGVEVGLHHMKAVLDDISNAKLSGEYNRQVVIYRPDYGYDAAAPFEDAVARNDASWIYFEHTDGYNYAFVNGFAFFNVVSTKNKVLTLKLKVGGGLGALIPRTQTSLHVDEFYHFYGRNNQFHFSGMGANLDGALQIVIGKPTKKWNVFTEVQLGAYGVRTWDAPINDQDPRGSGSIQHDMISYQLIFPRVGVRYNFGNK